MGAICSRPRHNEVASPKKAPRVGSPAAAAAADAECVRGAGGGNIIEEWTPASASPSGLSSQTTIAAGPEKTSVAQDGLQCLDPATVLTKWKELERCPESRWKVALKKNSTTVFTRKDGWIRYDVLTRLSVRQLRDILNHLDLVIGVNPKVATVEVIKTTPATLSEEHRRIDLRTQVFALITGHGMPFVSERYDVLRRCLFDLNDEDRPGFILYAESVEDDRIRDRFLRRVGLLREVQAKKYVRTRSITFRRGVPLTPTPSSPFRCMVRAYEWKDIGGSVPKFIAAIGIKKVPLGYLSIWRNVHEILSKRRASLKRRRKKKTATTSLGAVPETERPSGPPTTTTTTAVVKKGEAAAAEFQATDLSSVGLLAGFACAAFVFVLVGRRR